MAGINDLSGFTGPAQGGIKPNALAGSWGGSDAGGGGYDFTQQWGQGQQQGYPDWRRWFGMQRGGGGFLSRTNAMQPMAGVAQPDMGRPMSPAAPAPFTAPQAPQPMSPSPGFVGDRGAPAQQSSPVQPNDLWNSGIRKGGYLG